MSQNIADQVTESYNFSSWDTEIWDTPVRKVWSVNFISLKHANSLEIIVQEVLRENYSLKLGCEYSFLWDDNHSKIYRCWDESGRLELWKRIKETGQVGWTFKVENSPWKNYFLLKEPLLVFNLRDLVHFVIATENEVVEILSPCEPKITKIVS